VSDQMEQEVSRKSLLRRAALLVGVGSVGALAAPAVASATTKTGQYTGNGTTTQIATGLSQILALWIVTVPSHAPSDEAFTTNRIQTTKGQGTFLLNGRPDNGVAIELGAFTVTNPAMNENGIEYFWTADGD
jgi:hypothetical protein